MWRRLELRNFRSIEEASIELAPFSVIVGPNGSGKSNFADSLVFARDVGSDAVSAVQSRGGIASLRRWSKTKPYDVLVDVRISQTKEGLDRDYVRHQFVIRSGLEGKWSFKKELLEATSDFKVAIRVEREGNKIVASEKLRAPFTSLKPTTSVMVIARQLLPFRRYMALARVKHFRLNPDEMRSPQLISDTPRLEESGKNIATVLQKMHELADGQITPVMRRIIPGLRKIHVDQVGRYLTLRFEQAQGGDQFATFTADEMSEGALRALGIAVASLQMQRDELLIIEEPEVNIHIGAARLLFEVLQEASEKGSVLLTTHSADLLDVAQNEQILVCDYRDGVTRIGPMAQSQRDIVRKGLYSVAELMRSEPLRIEGAEPMVLGPEHNE